MMKLFWGKRLPRKIVFVTGLYTLTNGLVDSLWSPFTQNVLQRDAYDLKFRYGAGTHAVVTGATSDLGKAYASELAKKGFKLILVDSSDSVNAMASEMGATAF